MSNTHCIDSNVPPYKVFQTILQETWVLTLLHILFYDIGILTAWNNSIVMTFKILCSTLPIHFLWFTFAMMIYKSHKNHKSHKSRKGHQAPKRQSKLQNEKYLHQTFSHSSLVLYPQPHSVPDLKFQSLILDPAILCQSAFQNLCCGPFSWTLCLVLEWSNN